MPGSVGTAIAATVLPFSLCKLFRYMRTWPVIENDYKDGTSQRSSLIPLSGSTGTSRKIWELGKRLTSTQLESLRSFFEARKGAHQAFYFYDIYESAFIYDATGVSTTGRYTVRLDGDWQQAINFPRVDVSIRLVQVA